MQEQLQTFSAAKMEKLQPWGLEIYEAYVEIRIFRIKNRFFLVPSFVPESLRFKCNPNGNRIHLIIKKQTFTINQTHKFLFYCQLLKNALFFYGYILYLIR